MVSIEVEEETARKLEDLAKARNMTVPGYLKVVADRPNPDKSPDELSDEEWSALWQDWVTSHKPPAHPVDDSRASIYEGRGE